MAVENCRKANATLLVLHHFREVQFVAWQLEKMDAYGYVWASFSKQFLNTGEKKFSFLKLNFNKCNTVFHTLDCCPGGEEGPGATRSVAESFLI